MIKNKLGIFQFTEWIEEEKEEPQEQEVTKANKLPWFIIGWKMIIIYVKWYI